MNIELKRDDIYEEDKQYRLLDLRNTSSFHSVEARFVL